MQDTIYWKGSSSGKFTLKSALGYIKGVDSSNETISNIWRVIWKLPVQQRIKMFLWLAAHNQVLTNANRVRRNMGDDPTCPRCLEAEETLEHLLRSCHDSKFIWSQAGVETGINSFYNIPFHEWIELNASNSSPNIHSDWALEFSITCWWIWKWRNYVVFVRDSEIPSDIHGFLHNQFTATKMAFDRFDLLLPRGGQVHREVYIRWAPPPYQWIKLNTDGASKGNSGIAGSGGIFRDDTGNFVSAYHKFAGICSSMKAELIGLVLGLEEACRLRIPELLIEMDNSSCVNLMTSESLVSNDLRLLVARCRSLLAQANGSYIVVHCYREANMTTDWLANKGAEGNSDFLVMLPPPDLRSILREDVLRVTSSRVIKT